MRVSRFNAQDYVLERNPRYWKKGKPKIRCLEYIQATSNDAALLQIVSGKADWTHNFVPNVEKAYIAKNPRYYHAFYDVTAYPISLMFDTGQYPQPDPVPQGREHGHRPQQGVEARRVRLRTAHRRDRPVAAVTRRG